MNYTLQETNFIRRNYNRMPASQIALQLGRTENAIYEKAARMKIRKKRTDLKREALVVEFWQYKKLQNVRLDNEVIYLLLSRKFNLKFLQVQQMVQRTRI